MLSGSEPGDWVQTRPMSNIARPVHIQKVLGVRRRIFAKSLVDTFIFVKVTLLNAGMPSKFEL